MSSGPDPNSALGLARIGVGFIWWTSLAALVLIVLLTVVGPLVSDEVSFVVTNDVKVATMPASPDGRIGGVDIRSTGTPRIGDFRAELGYSPERIGTWLLSIVPVAVVALFWLLAIHQVRALLRDVASDRVFTEANADRIHRVGWILVVTAVFYPPTAWWMSRAAIGELGLRGSGLQPILPTDGWLLAVVTGWVVLGLGKVWRRGVEIENENRLTV